MVSFLLLGIVFILALIVKDYALAIAASLLGVLFAMGQNHLACYSAICFSDWYFLSHVISFSSHHIREDFE